MAFTVASLTVLTKITLAELNASSAYAAVSDDDKFTTDEIQELIFQGDERFYTAGAETRGHWMRPDIMDWSSVITANLSEVPAHIGELGDVRIKSTSGGTYNTAQKMSGPELEIIRNNRDSTFNADHNATGSLTSGYYDPDSLADGVCDFTGYGMQVRIVLPYARTAALQSPDSFASGLLAHALSVAFAKDGLDLNVAAYFSKEADKREAMVRRNAKMLDEVGQAA